ncbi:MAG: hypothetical protein Q4D70_00835, partial [bacterium]|nr:hypothetical protein [bacterium]
DRELPEHQDPRAVGRLKFFEIPPCAGAVTCDKLLRMGQQLRQRAKRNRRKAYAKRVNARLLAAKKAK